MTASTSRRAFSTISSMRVGWMRPSAISFSSARRATSRRTGSKQETVMASGVSSMMRSTPVSVSMRADVAALAADDAALHLVVGQGNHADGDLGDVIGGAALDGGRYDLAGMLVGFVLGAGLDLLDLEGGLVGDLGLDLLDQVLLGLVSRKAGDALRASRVWLRLMILISSFSLSRAACFWARASSFFSMASVLRSRFSSFCCKRRSCFCRSARRSFSSFSYSLRERRISSFASSVASRVFCSRRS